METIHTFPCHRNTPATLEEIEDIMKGTPQAILPVVGNCLEAADVQDGGWVAVDFTRYPAPPRYKSKGGDGTVDICLCYSTFPGRKRPAVMCKAYYGVFGPRQMVCTRYWDWQMNCGMVAERIFGVVFASWDRDGRLLWEREPESFPEKLGTASTIHGEVAAV